MLSGDISFGSFDFFSRMNDFTVHLSIAVDLCACGN